MNARYLCIGSKYHRQRGSHFYAREATIHVCHAHGFGTLRSLDARDLPAYARWCAEVGGRDLLDAFELAAINEHRLLEPNVDEGPEPVVIEWHADELLHGPGRILWTPCVECTCCDGTGKSNEWDAEEECRADCDECDGTGYNAGAQIVTDYDGNPVDDSYPESACREAVNAWQMRAALRKWVRDRQPIVTREAARPFNEKDHEHE